jgi:DNA-binding NtrC family response regulator
MNESKGHRPDLYDEDARTIKQDSAPLVSKRNRWCLLYVSGGVEADQGRSLRFQGGPVTIGRDEDCDLVLQDRNVSRKHVQVRVSPQGVAVADLGSTNGIGYLGRRIERATLSFGARIEVGETTIDLLPWSNDRTLPLAHRDRYGQLLGVSLPMRRLFTILEALESSDVPVLLEGETGTGKELAAQAIHDHSRRQKGPFVVIDCGTVPQGLMESELFGHRKGAFTGATDNQQGAFEAADGGTVFLDELGELPADLQPKLLRVLETGGFKRIGENQPRRVDVRVIAATKRNLEEEVAAGRFRDDLFYRVAVVRLELPPLRERTEDIPFLANHLARKAGLGSKEKLDGEVIEEFLHRNWPGNVRELRNAVQKTLALRSVGGGRTVSAVFCPSADRGRGSVDDEPVQPMPARDPQGAALTFVEIDGARVGFSTDILAQPYREARSRVIDHFERAYLERLWQKAQGNLSEASRIAGVDRSYIRRLLQKHNLY